MARTPMKLYRGMRARIGKRRRVALVEIDAGHFMIELKGLYDKDGNGPTEMRIRERGDHKVVTTHILCTRKTLGVLAGLFYKMAVDKETEAAEQADTEHRSRESGT
ncbi:MAG TPA: hypothetical protein VFM97_00180 [Gammaproteobacteria bacterium]|nr:hypothetical protein [Gammaproteobacteria bacterium]